MNNNMNDIADFDAFVDEVRCVYDERDGLRDEVEALRQFIKDICEALGVRSDMSTRESILGEISKLRREHENHKTTIKKQEDFTEEAASILGVHPGDLTLSDVLEALRKLKREEKLDEMNSSIIADLRTEFDMSQRAFSGEHSRRLAAEKYISDTFRRAAKELGITRIPDGIDTLCDEISDLRNYRNRISCPKEFWEAICDIMEMNSADATPSDVIGMTREVKQRLISILALNPKTATWTDIYDAIKAEQKDHCDLISESYKMRNELSDVKDVMSGLSNTCTGLKNERNEALNKVKRYKELNNMNASIIAELTTERDNLQRYISDRLSKICSALGIEYSTDTTLEYILDTIDDLRSKKCTNSQPHVFSSVCDYLGIAADDATLSDIHKEIEKLKGWKTVAADHDTRRKHWVRRYKEEHERAVNLDKLYREWKDKYETYYKKTSNMTEQNESLMASYMAVKNTAIKQKDILKVVCRYLAGKDTMPDKDIVVRLNEMWTKEIGWDGLVLHYGKTAIRELVDACDAEITETTRKDLDEMLST